MVAGIRISGAKAWNASLPIAKRRVSAPGCGTIQTEHGTMRRSVRVRLCTIPLFASRRCAGSRSMEWLVSRSIFLPATSKKRFDSTNRFSAMPTTIRYKSSSTVALCRAVGKECIPTIARARLSWLPRTWCLISIFAIWKRGMLRFIPSAAMPLPPWSLAVQCCKSV